MSKIVETEKCGLLLSHLQRMCQPKKSYPKFLCQDYDVRGTEEVVVNGRVVKKSAVKSVHPQDLFKGFKADDFALENIVTVGAFDSLKVGYLIANTSSELSDRMEGTIDNVINAVDAAEDPQSNVGGNE